ncbi:hypothetical protein [Pseudomonas kurunegalensis]|uniref:hypothetical protein n=1 Tax=Pseudomonas kurunegalensis TaxID=485880 RepID=UPI00326029D7
MKTSKESELLRDLYNDWSHRLTINPNISIKDLRSMFDEWAQPALEPENVRYKSEKLGGVEAIWALPDEADSSSVIIYIHGGGFAVGSADSHSLQTAIESWPAI